MTQRDWKNNTRGKAAASHWVHRALGREAFTSGERYAALRARLEMSDRDDVRGAAVPDIGRGYLFGPR